MQKKGYTGRLSYDDEIKSMHGFNAHDYSAETLANFFALAEKENFPLNQSELHLRSILLENGVIRFENGKLVEGAGALLSISQESTLPFATHSWDTKPIMEFILQKTF